MMQRTLTVLALLMCACLPCRAGGPAFVAGSVFDPGVKGQPILWANGNVQYFTDQGDLSPILNNSQADAFVANAMTRWTNLPYVALSATEVGHLAEDVNGTNVACDPQGNCTMPSDIQPTALTTPVGIVYDNDGQVTDALLGAGAGGLDYCFTNAAYGGPDNFSTGAHIVHALVVINGVCAATNSQLPDVQYRLVRTLGRVVGLGWSQANLNVQTRDPIPGNDDFQGFALMHFYDSIACVPIGACYPDADTPKMDDRAALGRMYPVTSDNQGGFPGKQLFAPQTARIHGSVLFTDADGNPLQAMQGVNVVARRIDAGQPSRRWVATSVSGFAFRGNAGNVINGYVDPRGLRYDRFGSDDSALEGAFDLAGLEFADGDQTAQYELSVEALDAYWSLGVGPYAPWQAAPSGTFAPVTIAVQRGSDVTQDVLMRQSAVAGVHPGSGGTYANPAILPAGGGWGAWISGYGDADWFQFTAQASRTASVTATAFDERRQPTQSKVLPAIGIWPLSDQSGGPAWAATPMPFNTAIPGMSRLDAQFGAAGTFRLGVADFRGDGRPDYFYVASLLYSDTVTPARMGLQGGPVTLTGLGFHPGLQVSAGSNPGNVLSASANQIEVVLPARSQDGSVTLTVTDPVTGGTSQMQDALAYGASPTDLLLLVQGAEPATPVGSEAANPIRVRAVAADGTTPVGGATVAWSASNGAQLSACGGGTSCSALSDESGEVSTRVVPTATGVSTIAAMLAPAVYSSPQTVQATVMGISSPLDLAAVAPSKWIGQGATIDVPTTARVLSLGAPQPGVVVNFMVTKGAATLTATSATTDNSGSATVTAQLLNHAADVQVSACLTPNNNPCVTFTLFATPASLWTLQAVSGSDQVVPAGQPFQPLVLRVTDGSPASNPVMGANVVFDTVLARISPDQGSRDDGDTIIRGTGMPVILGSSETQVASDGDGLASMVPSTGNVTGPCDLLIAASAGNALLQLQLESEAGAETRPAGPVRPLRPQLSEGRTRPKE